MKTSLTHVVKQFYYKWIKLFNDSSYKILDDIYKINRSAMSNIHRHPQALGYIMADFSCPDYFVYRGKELVFFNGRQVCVYWLPGALHSAGGYVSNNTYYVSLNQFALSQPLYLQVTKLDEKTTVDKISLFPEAGKIYDALNGGFVPYNSIKKEIHALIMQWLGGSKLLGSTMDKKQVLKIIQKCKSLNSTDIYQKASSII